MLQRKLELSEPHRVGCMCGATANAAGFSIDVISISLAGAAA
jgi:hypothetical protein